MKPYSLVRNWLLILREMVRRWVLGGLWKMGLLQVVSREAMLDNPAVGDIHTFGRPHEIKAELPTSMNAIPEPAASMVHQSVKLEAPFVAVLNDVFLVGKGAICIGSHREIYMESVMSDSVAGELYFEALPLRSLVMREMTRLATPEMDRVCSLVHIWGCHTYAHWLMECLPRLEGLEYYEHLSGQTVPLLVHANLRSWQRESLQLLGYGPDRYQFWEGPRVKVKQLIMPSFRRQRHWSEPDAFAWIRTRLLQNLPAPTERSPTLSPRIFISRANAASRRIVNEAQVMALLSTYDFVSYVPEALNFADEVRLFAQAEAILGTHGSGLINMVFATQRPWIIDLYSTWYTESVFQMASSLGFPYACCYCEPAGGTDSGQKTGDIRVNLNQLQQLLNCLFPQG